MRGRVFPRTRALHGWEDGGMLAVSWDTVRLFLHVLAALFLGVLLAG